MLWLISGAYKASVLQTIAVYILCLYTSILQTSGAEGENCENLVGRQQLLPPGMLWMHRLELFLYEWGCKWDFWHTFCTDLIIPSKKVITYPNNKAWVMNEIKAGINKKNRVFYSGEKNQSMEKSRMKSGRPKLSTKIKLKVSIVAVTLEHQLISRLVRPVRAFV